MKKRAMHYLMILVILFTLVLSGFVFAAVASDENFDDNSTFGESLDNPLIIDEIKYEQLEGSDKIIISNQPGSMLSDGGPDYYINIQSDRIRISLENGEAFKLQGFSIDALADQDIVISSSVGEASNRIFSSAGDWLTQNIDFSADSNYENITYFEISGDTMLCYLDDLDFDNPVLPTYSITYSSNGETSGTAPTDGTAYNKNDVTNLATNSGGLTKTGYTFTGWNKASDGSDTHYDAGEEVTIVADLNLYAEWTAIDYSVTYNGNGSDSGDSPIDSNDYNINDTVTVLSENTLTKLGYTFVEWDTASDGSGTAYSESDTFAMGSSDVTLYAQWDRDEYSVTYSSNSATSGSAPIDASIYYYNDSATLSSNSGSLARTGYTFAGWNTESDGSGNHYNENQSVTMTGDLSLYAEWTAIDYTVAYNGNGADSGDSPTDSNAYNINDTVTVLGENTLSKLHNTFAGWNIASDGSGTAYSESDTFAMGSSDVTLYAQWDRDEYSVTYNSNSATSGSAPIDATVYYYNDSSTLSSNSGSLVRTGYTFTGWNTASDGSGNHYNENQSVTMKGNLSLYAQWTAIDYSVTYDSNGADSGDVPTDSNTYNITDEVSVLGANTISKNDYVFAGWNTANDGSGTIYIENDTFEVGSSNITLYAMWGHSVKYDGNGASSGSVPVDSKIYDTNDTVNVLDTGELKRNGYTFVGWNTAENGSGTTYVKDDTLQVASTNIVLYARWNQDEYDVIYESNGSTFGSIPIDSNIYHYGDTITAASNSGSLGKNGYNFNGWNTFSDGSGNQYSVGDSISCDGNLTLYAQWKIISSSSGDKSSGSSSNTSNDNTNSDTPKSAYVEVDGQKKSAGKVIEKVEDGLKITKVTVDTKKLDKVLDGELKNAVVTVPISDKTDVAVAGLTGDMVKKMELKETVLEVKNKGATYSLPASDINIDAVSKEFGEKVALSNIRVEIEISKPSKELVKKAEEVSKLNNYSLVVPATEFDVKCKYKNKNIEIKKFNTYVERTLPIPDSVDKSKITTGVVINEDGTMRHVPTKVIEIDGKYYAKINSLTNSSYSVIWNPKRFSDLEGHWAEYSVDSMASRMILLPSDSDFYRPDDSISYEDFVSTVIRSLGLEESYYLSDGKTLLYKDNLLIAYEHNLIDDYDKSKIKRKDKISREEAMIIISKASIITGIYEDLSNFEANRILSAYNDVSSQSENRLLIANCIKNEIITGTSENKLSSNEKITRAEVAVIIERLLKKSNLI